MRDIKPMVIAIWCGFSKPNSLTEYLQPFVDELNYLIRNGITINDYQINLSIRCFICDAPARAFLKGMNIFHRNFV